jgi:RHS repeat-associated protein
VLARSQIQEVFPLAACSRLAENSRLGFQPVASTSQWGSGFSISSSTLGLSASLYDGRVRPRSTGKERDTESGNDYFFARYYASSMGRFLSPDWAAKAEPVPYAKLENPQTLNLYQYVGNNPLTGIDPSGHMCVMHMNYNEHGDQDGGTMSCDTPAESSCFQSGANCNKARIRPVPGYSENGNNLWRTANDALIIQAVDVFNDAHGYSSGDSGYLTPELVKAWMMEESGGTQSAFLRDPMQVNNPGDWTDLKTEMGLAKGESMTRGISIAAALGWLEYKGTPGRMDKFGEYIYTGSYRGDRNALTNYNGNTRIYPQDGGVQKRYVYSDQILSRTNQMLP